MNFGEKFSYQMLKKGYNHSTEFAPTVNLSADTINQYKKKKTPDGIDIMKIYRIAKKLGVTIDYLLTTEEDENIQIDNYKYINIESTDTIQIEDFTKEIISIITNKNIIYNDKEIEDEKKYIIDSIDIGMKLLKQNI